MGIIMPYKLDFVMPSQNELKNIVKDYKIMDDTKKPEEMDLGDNTSPLKDEIEKFKVWMDDWSGNIIPEFENKIEILLNTEKKMNSEVYKLKKSESINRRLVEFYSKDYDL